MFKKINGLALFSLLVVYLIQLAVPFIGDFSNELQEVRRQNQIAKAKLIEKKTFSITYWNSQKNKNEIVINNNFYDVISHTIHNDVVFVRVVKDNFEPIFKSAIKNILNQKKHQNSGKKKVIKLVTPSVLVENIVVENEYQTIDRITPFVFFKEGNTTKFCKSTFKPPCCFS